MSDKLKRLRKKRALQKKNNAREIILQKQNKALLGTDKMEDRMINYHQDVLQNIEFALITKYRSDKRIDDSVVTDALESIISSQEPENELSEELINELQLARQIRNDVDDDIWHDGLRTVLRSVRRHSDLQPGNRDYINFAGQFII